jgi:antitoxin FitA
MDGNFIQSIALVQLDMCIACVHALNMSRMIQLRNVPDNLHRILKARAAMAGMSLSDYLLEEIRQVARRPTLAELRERMQRRSAVSASPPAAEAVRREREAR